MKLMYLIVILGACAIGRTQFTVIPTGTDDRIKSMRMHGDTLVIKGFLNYFAKSYDMGQSIQILPTNLPTDNSYDNLHVVDDVYYLQGQDRTPYTGLVFQSTDYGNHWDVLHSTPGLYSHLTVYDSTHMIFGGYGGGNLSVRSPSLGWYDYQPLWLGGGVFETSVYYNADTIFLGRSFGGLSLLAFDGIVTASSWNQAGIQYDGRESQFISKDTLYVAGYDSHNILFNYSYDMGANFTAVDFIYIPSLSSFESTANAMWFENSMHGYLFGSSGLWFEESTCTIYETHDGGLSWSYFKLEYPGWISSFAKANDSIFFLGCDDGLLLKWNRNEPLYSLDIDEVSSTRGVVSLFPNPANSEVYITIDDDLSHSATISIYDVSGKLFRELPFQNTLNIKDLRAGVYIVAINSYQGLLGQQKLIVD